MYKWNMEQVIATGCQLSSSPNQLFLQVFLVQVLEGLPLSIRFSFFKTKSKKKSKLTFLVAREYGITQPPTFPHQIWLPFFDSTVCLTKIQFTRTFVNQYILSKQ